MNTAQLNDIVTVTYEGFLESGETFESSGDTGPLEFQIGSGIVMECFEEGVIGMSINETRKLVLEPKDAYGEKQEELIHTVDRSLIGINADIKPGMVVQFNMDNDGQSYQVPATVTKIEDNMVTVDYNHPLAGEKIIFEITLKDIKRETTATPAGILSEPESGCGRCH